MSKLGEEVLLSARSRLGRPFRHHFKPVNVCEYGFLTLDECMERGMDSGGYDCSGLVIASLCEVLGLPKSEWPREFRHAQQLSAFASDEDFSPGDFRLYYSNDGIHMGVATETEEVVHASGRTKTVVESVVIAPKGSFDAVRVIAVESLVNALGK